MVGLYVSHERLHEMTHGSSYDVHPDLDACPVWVKVGSVSNIGLTPLSVFLLFIDSTTVYPFRYFRSSRYTSLAESLTTPHSPSIPCGESLLDSPLNDPVMEIDP